MAKAEKREGKPRKTTTAPRPAGKPSVKKSPLKLAGKPAGKTGKKPARPAPFHLEEDLLDRVVRSTESHLVDNGDRLDDVQLTHAFHHLQRAGAVISLLETASSGELRELLEHGITLYRKASGKKRRKASVQCAFGLLRAAEHLSMARLYESRSETRVEVAPPPRSAVEEHLRKLAPRLDRLSPPERANGRRLEAMARDLLHRAEGASHDPHLEYELTMAADGICAALEEGL